MVQMPMTIRPFVDSPNRVIDAYRGLYPPMTPTGVYNWVRDRAESGTK